MSGRYLNLSTQPTPHRCDLPLLFGAVRMAGDDRPEVNLGVGIVWECDECHALHVVAHSCGCGGDIERHNGRGMHSDFHVWRDATPRERRKWRRRFPLPSTRRPQTGGAHPQRIDGIRRSMPMTPPKGGSGQSAQVK